MTEEAENARAVVGDNGGVSAEAIEALKSIVQRINTLEDEKKDLGGDIKSVYAEAKSKGYDTKALRKVVRIMRADEDRLDEQQALLETYCNALGIKSYLL